MSPALTTLAYQIIEINKKCVKILFVFLVLGKFWNCFVILLVKINRMCSKRPSPILDKISLLFRSIRSVRWKEMFSHFITKFVLVKPHCCWTFFHPMSKPVAVTACNLRKGTQHWNSQILMANAPTSLCNNLILTPVVNKSLWSGCCVVILLQ